MDDLFKSMNDLFKGYDSDSWDDFIEKKYGIVSFDKFKKQKELYEEKEEVKKEQLIIKCFENKYKDFIKMLEDYYLPAISLGVHQMLVAERALLENAIHPDEEEFALSDEERETLSKIIDSRRERMITYIDDLSRKDLCPIKKGEENENMSDLQ